MSPVLLRCGSLSEVVAAEWDALAGSAQPFLSHAFLSSLEDSGSVGGDSGWRPVHRLYRDDDGRLRAAMPAYVKQHSFGEYVFDIAWADACRRAGIAYYPKLLAAVPFTPVQGPRLLGDTRACAALLDALPAQALDEGLSGVHVNFTDAAGDALLHGRDGWLERLGCQFHWFDRGYRDFQDFLDALSSRKRKQIRKEREQVAGQGIDFERRRGDQLSESEWDFVYACYANTYHVRGRLPYLTRAFFSLLAERMPQALQLVFARRAGRAVAMTFSLLDEDCLYGRYWGCLDEYDRLHFETCFYQGIEQALDLGLRRFDAGAQGEHKLLRGFEPVLTRSWHWLAHPGLLVAVADFLAAEGPAMRAYAEQAREALPYRRNDGA